MSQKHVKDIKPDEGKIKTDPLIGEVKPAFGDLRDKAEDLKSQAEAKFNEVISRHERD